MKKFLLSVIACLMSCFVFAQTPNVDISIDEVTTSTITASFTKNEYCSSYHYMIAEIGELEMWLQSPMFAGMTLPDLVMSWGIEAETGYIYTFDDLIPNTPYVVYVVVHSQLPDILVTDTTQTLGQGGVGESVISIQVTEITENSARVICTPNEETSEFRDMLIIKDSCLVWSLDSAVEYLKNDPYVLYTVDDHVWQLNPNTTYFVLAIGLNANGEWGELAQYEFTTLEETSVCDFASNLSIYPNPAHECVNLNNLPVGATLTFADLQGRIILTQTIQNTQMTIPVNAYAKGMYLLRITDGTSTVAKKIVVK